MVDYPFKAPRSIKQLVSGRIGNVGLSSTLYVPLFIYPGPTGIQQWQRVANVKKEYPWLRVVACINPNSGNFTAANADFTRGIELLEGIEKIGYIATDYGARPLEEVKAGIDAYRQFYPQITGFFLDEMKANEPGFEAYYKAITSYAKGYTVGNPGSAMIESYVNTVNCTLIYESEGLLSLKDVWARTFAGKYSKSNFGIIPHTSPFDKDWVMQACKMCDLVYVTSDVMSNPWDSLPPYFEELAKCLAYC